MASYCAAIIFRSLKFLKKLNLVTEKNEKVQVDQNQQSTLKEGRRLIIFAEVDLEPVDVWSVDVRAVDLKS